ncbi:MAG: DUF1311 domain-containing protein [Desulfobacterales bacterium]|nr:DUF1311 domain-containing protein [Desulfobacterales bacterium]
MLKKTILFGLFFAAVFTSLVFADQAAWIEKSDADKASQAINPGIVLRKFCAPCGDSAWTAITVRKVEVKHKESSNYQVEVNGQGIDLAYVYIEKNSRWVNLAIHLGLTVSDVPEFLSDPASVRHIDKISDECMAKDSTTAGMMNCISEAYKLWDAELNKVYNQLRAALKPDAKKSLKAAQLQWIKYRDSEFKLIDSIYSSLEGTMYIPMRAGDRMEIVKNRTKELESYLNLIKMGE